MAFKEVLDLECEAIQLGGIDKKTGKKNPTQLEGFYIGSRKVDSPKYKTGFSNLHVFNTAKGNFGVWGKTDLDGKMKSVTLGAMTRVTYTGMQETKNNPMYKFKVEIDAENSIEVPTGDAPSADNYQVGSASTESFGGDGEDETDVDADEQAPDEVPVQRAAPTRRPLSTPSASSQAEIQTLLNSKRQRTV